VLLDQSFVQRLETPETCWKMLQPLRELAAEQVARNPLADTWRDRHAQFFLGMIEGSIRKREQGGIDDRARYLPDYPNIRAGMVWVTGQGQADLAYRYLCTIGFFWLAFGPAAQDSLLTEQVLALPAPTDRRMLLRALEVSTYSLEGPGQIKAAEARFLAILAICEELGDVDAAAMTNLSLADVELETGRAEQAWERVQLVLQGEPERMIGGFQTPRGRMNPPSARRTAAECLLELGRYGEALEYATLAHQSFREVGNHVQRLGTENLMGRLLLYLHRRAEAVTLLLACLHESVANGFRGVANTVLSRSLTALAAEVQDWRTLVQFVAFVHGPRWEASQSASDRQFQRDLFLARETMGETGFQEAWVAGTRLLVPDAVELAEQLAHNLTAERLSIQLPSTQHRSMLQRRPETTSGVRSELTPREWEVLALVAQGHPDRRIARLLSISPATASKHVSNLLGKLALRNRVELARWAIEQGAFRPS
jgi:DNA-binding CsgD family transcriptional regulator/tetratricopeptide (TPR) repeat protein